VNDINEEIDAGHPLMDSQQLMDEEHDVHHEYIWPCQCSGKLITDLSLQRTMFVPVHVGFVVDKAALGQVYLRVLCASPVNIIPPYLHTHTPS
jgi:hypothetical protein